MSPCEYIRPQPFNLCKKVTRHIVADAHPKPAAHRKQRIQETLTDPADLPERRWGGQKDTLPAEWLEMKEEARLAAEEISALSGKPRAVVAEYYNGTPPDEIARQLGMSKAAVRQNLARRHSARDSATLAASAPSAACVLRRRSERRHDREGLYRREGFRHLYDNYPSPRKKASRSRAGRPDQVSAMGRKRRAVGECREGLGAGRGRGSSREETLQKLVANAAARAVNVARKRAEIAEREAADRADER
jgi:hypothetical protein